MGKNSIIKSLAKVIGNVAMHKLLLEHTNKSESKTYLKNEIIEYSINAFEKAQEFNWNENDKIEIREKSLERLKAIGKNYPDIFYKKQEAEYIIEQIIDELEL